ncbi:MAG: NRDE family protein [Candidatus Eisenbacteria bacterium]|uniref:NRDE family protein n=1 Tax=Eiseniibacteriota bacterium TaxID=2212470 RepID=A0A538T303_UNCEI|nr:MAG: NRDE family protein [Candidatus Eisenbacteria bacterium]
MCTLILGLGILGPGSVLLGANRDESPKRPSSDPGVLVEAPRVVGGRDLVSGGTWLAVREARFVTALMNRRPVAGDKRDPATLRSRGMLCLDVAAGRDPGGAGSAAADSHLDHALRLVKRDPYAPCTLVGVGVDGEGWALHAGPSEPLVHAIPRGWHVITHREVDDPSEPRTKWLLEQIAERRPWSVDEAFGLIAGYLRSHGEGGTPPVCLHRELFPTVSSSMLALGMSGGPRYLHAPGPPCVTEYRDYSSLLQTGGNARDR